MFVTDIIEIDKSRVKIYIDGEFAFALYKGELHIYGVEKGREITREAIDKIYSEVLIKRCRLRAMNLLIKREYTVATLRKKLKDGFYPDEIIWNALDYVASFHYTDDYRYAYGYISDHALDKSVKRIEQDLFAKGIERDVYAKVLSDFEANGGCIDEKAMIKRLLIKRHYNADCSDIRERNKQINYLISKGFSFETINCVLKTDIFE